MKVFFNKGGNQIDFPLQLKNLQILKTSLNFE